MLRKTCKVRGRTLPTASSSDQRLSTLFVLMIFTRACSAFLCHTYVGATRNNDINIQVNIRSTQTSTSAHHKRQYQPITDINIKPKQLLASAHQKHQHQANTNIISKSQTSTLAHHKHQQNANTNINIRPTQTSA